MDTSISLAGMTLEHPLMNAAGTCKHLDGPEGEITVKELARSATAAVVVGSMTKLERGGNAGEVYRTWDGYSLNSMGLPNPGIEACRSDIFPEMGNLCRKVNKSLIISVAGFTPQEYAELASVALKCADAVELNVGCPNVWKGGEQKRIASYCPRLIENFLEAVDRIWDHTRQLSIKLSPIPDPWLLAEIVDVIKYFSKLVKFVTASNTFPNAFAFSDDRKGTAITPGGGLAGMAGPALKPIVLGQIRQLRDLLPDEIQIVGVGGITTGRDMLDYLNAGADAVQIATVLLDKGLDVFGKILAEYVSLIEE